MYTNCKAVFYGDDNKAEPCVIIRISGQVVIYTKFGEKGRIYENAIDGLIAIGKLADEGMYVSEDLYEWLLRELNDIADYVKLSEALMKGGK